VGPFFLENHRRARMLVFFYRGAPKGGGGGGGRPGDRHRECVVKKSHVSTVFGRRHHEPHQIGASPTPPSPQRQNFARENESKKKKGSPLLALPRRQSGATRPLGRGAPPLCTTFSRGPGKKKKKKKKKKKNGISAKSGFDSSRLIPMAQTHEMKLVLQWGGRIGDRDLRAGYFLENCKKIKLNAVGEGAKKKTSR